METALVLAEGVAQVEIVPAKGDEGDEPELLTFSEKLARPSDGKSFEELAPRNFSFNSPYGACPACDGLGTVFEVDPELVVPDPELSVRDGALAPWASGHAKYFHRLLDSVCEEFEIDPTESFAALPAKDRKLLLHGVEGDKVSVKFRNRYGRTRTYSARYEGVIPYLKRRHAEAETDSAREAVEGYMRQVPCATCDGARLNAYALAVTVGDMNMHELSAMSIAETAETLLSIQLDDRQALIAERVLKEINAHGVSIVRVARGTEGRWDVVADPRNRRITAANQLLT